MTDKEPCISYEPYLISLLFCYYTIKKKKGDFYFYHLTDVPNGKQVKVIEAFDSTS